MRGTINNYLDFWDTLANKIGPWIIILLILPLTIIPSLILLVYKFNDNRKLVKCRGNCGAKLKLLYESADPICFNCLRDEKKLITQSD